MGDDIVEPEPLILQIEYIRLPYIAVCQTKLINPG